MGMPIFELSLLVAVVVFAVSLVRGRDVPDALGRSLAAGVVAFVAVLVIGFVLSLLAGIMVLGLALLILALPLIGLAALVWFLLNAGRRDRISNRYS
jgi:hypothetical protein